MSGTAIDALQAIVASMLAVVAPETVEPLLRDLVRRLGLAIARASDTTTPAASASAGAADLSPQYVAQPTRSASP